MFFIIYLSSCKPKSAPAASKKEFVSGEFTNAHVFSKEAGFTNMDLRAPLIREYSSELDPKAKLYTIFSKGIEASFYKKGGGSSLYLKADWAKHLEKEELYEAKGNVILISEAGQKLKTSHVFWDKKRKKIYSASPCEVHQANGTVLNAKDGLESSDDLKEIILKNTDGLIILNENSSNE